KFKKLRRGSRETRGAQTQESSLIMGQVAFYEKMIGLWSAKSREASEQADLAAFEFAEGELANYQEMLKRHLQTKSVE
ncbi:hypothetical protein MM809_32965, partial [Klebsiella pneumoniae]|nr:hypothetical protein [Klebsiella pneumoniae]